MNKGLGKIYELAKWNPGLSQAEALKLAESKGLSLLTLKEANIIMKDDKLKEKYYDYWPFWTSTKVDMKGTGCRISEHGMKPIDKTIPLNDGWYEVDKLGLPFGKASSGDNPDALYLWRIKNYVGLVARGDGDFDGGRYVYCYGYVRFGVLAVKKNLKVKNDEKRRKK